MALPNSVVDGWLAAQAPYLERGPTFTPAGTHPVCALGLHYDVIFGQPLDVNEVTHYVIDLKPKAGFACNNQFGIPLPAGPVSFFPLMHESDANFVAQGQAVFGYNSFLGQFSRNYAPTATSLTGSALTPANGTLAFSGTFYSHTGLNAAGLANLSHMSAALNAPVFGNKATGPSWSQVNWNASATTVQSENAVFSWTSSALPSPISQSNAPGLNQIQGGWMHFDHVPFQATIPVDCQ